MEKIANPTHSSQTESKAILEHTRRLMAESRAPVQAMVLADGFTPRSLRQARRLAA